MQRLYDDNLFRFDSRQPSYWEASVGDLPLDAAPLESNESCDVAIIGGGYTGLSAALHLARDHDVDVRVLEAGHIGWGASGRNGGFCGIGGTGLQRGEFLRRRGEQAARDYYRSQREAVELVRQLARDESIDIDARGAAEIEVAHSASAYRHLCAEHELSSQRLGLQTELVPAAEFRERFFESTEQHGALLSKPTFGLHPLKFCRGLAAAGVRRGAQLHEHSEVLEWSRGADGLHRLRTEGGTLRAGSVLLATNGFTPECLNPEFRARTLPVISAIVVTRPLEAGELAAHNWRNEHPTINSRRVLNYFRLLPDGRFLFGGRGFSDGSEAHERRTYARLEATMRRLWPEWAAVPIEYRWHGLICFTASRCPSIGHLDDDASVFFGYGYHGNGVNTATWAGRQLATWIATGRKPAMPEIVTGLGGRFPLPALRLKYLEIAIALATLRDRYT